MRRIAILAGLLLALGAVGAAAWFALGPGGRATVPNQTPARTEEESGEPEEPGTVRIAGRVEDESGEPVVDADVYLLEKGDPIVPPPGPRHARTDTGGRFSLLCEEGLIPDLIAVSPGYRPSLVPHVAEGTGIRVVLPSGGEIRGVVTDDRGRPVVGASIFAKSSGTEIAPPRGIYYPHHATLGVTYVRALSGLGGRFVLRGIGEGPVDIRAEKRTHPELLRPVLGAKAGEDGVKLVLLHRFTASVFVVDAHGNAPIISAWVKIEMEDREPIQGRTDRSGEMRATLDFPAARAPDALVKVSAGTEDFGNVVAEDVPLMELADGADFKLILVKKDPAILHVKLTYDTGLPYRGWVYFEIEPEVGSKFNRWSRREKGGVSTIKMPPGRYTVIRARGQAPLSGAEVRNLTLAPGEELTQEITVVRGGDLSLAVTGGKDAEVRGAKVEVAYQGGKRTYRLWGRRRKITDLPPGPAAITVTHPGFETVLEKVDLVKGEEKKVTLELRRRPR